MSHYRNINRWLLSMIPADTVSISHFYCTSPAFLYTLFIETMYCFKYVWFYYSPYVYFFRHRLISYHFWRHPGHRARKRHLCTFVTELFGRPKVRDFHSVIVGDQNTKTDTNRRHTHTHLLARFENVSYASLDRWCSNSRVIIKTHDHSFISKCQTLLQVRRHGRHSKFFMWHSTGFNAQWIYFVAFSI